MCLPQAWNCVCSVLSPQVGNCNMVSVGTELSEHDLRRCGKICLWLPQAQALCKTLFMYYICINVLCIAMQCSASTQLCHFLSRKCRNVCLLRAWNCVPSASMECVLCTVSAAAMNVLCMQQPNCSIHHITPALSKSSDLVE